MFITLLGLLFFWAGITVIGLIIAALYWALKIVIYIAFISLFVAIVAAVFYHFYWAKKD